VYVLTALSPTANADSECSLLGQEKVILRTKGFALESDMIELPPDPVDALNVLILIAAAVSASRDRVAVRIGEAEERTRYEEWRASQSPALPNPDAAADADHDAAKTAARDGDIDDLPF
jgi:hypothetical protein